ncbi:hypothetical protein MBLNU230_g6165t1 [Neophaeotheca triangularis]
MRFLSAVTTALLAASVSATNPTDQTPLLSHASDNRGVSAELFSELEEFARIVDIAYCVSLGGIGIRKPFSCLSRCSDFPTFELVTTWNTGPLLSDSCGYIALDHGKRRVIVAFRGTYSIANTVVDLSTIPQAYEPYPASDSHNHLRCHNCTVHRGFHTSWLNTRDKILTSLLLQLELQPDYTLHMVGHSLGGAVAALAALDLLARDYNPIVTTFGEPRIGNNRLVEYLDERFDLKIPQRDGQKFRRITHIDDPVPLLPLTEWGYAMHAGEIFISKPSLSPDIADLEHCIGDDDDNCIASQDASLTSGGEGSKVKRDLLASVEDEVQDVLNEPWGVPSRYKLWQLFFAHRDYFWRLGLCVPGGDPLGGGGKYAYDIREL